MNIDKLTSKLRNMECNIECEIAEVIGKDTNGKTLSYIVYLVDSPSFDDYVMPCKHERIFASVDEFVSYIEDTDCYDFDVREFVSDFQQKIDPQPKSKTILWYKVKCSLFKEEFGVIKWSDLVEFMSHTIGFDYTITGQYDEPYTGVEVYYANGQMYKL